MTLGRWRSSGTLARTIGGSLRLADGAGGSELHLAVIGAAGGRRPGCG